MRALRSRFRELFGRDAAPLLAVAPGRVNLIGEHTDYNDGFVLPMAIARWVAVAYAPRDDGTLRAHAVAFDETRDVALRGLEPQPGLGWFGYVAGVAWAMAAEGPRPAGADLLVAGDVPLGAGLSSSAALEMATARALCAVSGIAWAAASMARIGQKAEGEFVGVSCGVMDQIASAAGQEGCALLLDCRSLEIQTVPIPEQAAVVVMDSGVRRSLEQSAYNQRRGSCEAAVAALRERIPGLRALRDVDEELLASGRTRMDPVAFRRATHVVAENRRPHAFAAALRAGDLPEAGRLMNDSHASLRDLYEVSCPELDRLTDLARRHPACFGARLTGAGFGGCAVALVAASELASFVAEVSLAYGQSAAGFLVCRPARGACLVAPGEESVLEG